MLVHLLCAPLLPTGPTEPLRPCRLEGHSAPGDRVERVLLGRYVGTTLRHAADELDGKSLMPRRRDRESHEVVRSRPV